MAADGIGIILSGGGARGLAHLGVLQVLTAAGIKIKWIGGSSIGGLIAAGYAAGYSVETMIGWSHRFSRLWTWIQLFNYTSPQRSLLNAAQVRRFIQQCLGSGRTLSDLPIPLALSSVDLRSGRVHPITSGDLITAVLASLSIPGLLPPVSCGRAWLVDGGVLNNVPTYLAKSLGDGPFIAVNAQHDATIHPTWQDLETRPFWPVPLPDCALDFYRAQIMMVTDLTNFQLGALPPDLLIAPPIPGHITMFLGFRYIPEIIAYGAAATRHALPAISRLVDQ